MSAPSEHVARSGLTEVHLLDSVIWQALTNAQSHLAEGDACARRFPTELAPFGAMADFTRASFRSLRSLLRPNERVAFFTPEAVPADSSFIVARSEPIDQMILAGNGLQPAPMRRDIVALGASDIPEMLALAAETQPGPFSARVRDFGQYVGIRQNGKLVAMAGERMRLPGYTEISAVCVSNSSRGQGLAAQVVIAVADLIRQRSETPFLHVFSNNTAAAALYLKLGFALRRTMRLTVLELAATNAGHPVS